MITRRCSERRFLMRPDEETNNAFVYCLAWAAQRTRVEVIFFLAMSNHYHAGVVDTEGRLPEFLETFHKLFAKHQNVLRGRWENFWASEQTSVVQLVGPEDVLDKMTYTLANPVQGHLVERSRHWPGSSSYFSHLSGRALRATRPTRFFRADGPMPDNVTLELKRPPGWEGLSEDEYRKTLLDQLTVREEAAARERRLRNISVLGLDGVLRQRWSDAPVTEESRRNLNPRLACKNRWRRIEVLARNRAFLECYRAALERFRAGVDSIFPLGTYWLKRFFRVACDTDTAVAVT